MLQIIGSWPFHYFIISFQQAENVFKYQQVDDYLISYLRADRYVHD